MVVKVDFNKKARDTLVESESDRKREAAIVQLQELGTIAEQLKKGDAVILEAEVDDNWKFRMVVGDPSAPGTKIVITTEVVS